MMLYITLLVLCSIKWSVRMNGVCVISRSHSDTHLTSLNRKRRIVPQKHHLEDIFAKKSTS